MALSREEYDKLLRTDYESESIKSARKSSTITTSSGNVIQAESKVVSQVSSKNFVLPYKNISYLTNTSTNKYTKIYDSNTHGQLQDILFVNASTSETLTFNLLLSQYNLDQDSSKLPNQTLENHPTTVYLMRQKGIAAATAFAANAKQHSLSGVIGTEKQFTSGTSPFYLYIYKQNDQGQLDVTVLL
jgi:hypothetical protein